MKIGIDLDDVVSDFANQFLEYHNRTYGTTFSRNQIRHYDLSRLWNGCQEDAVLRIEEFVQSDLHKSMGPFPGSEDSIDKLLNKNDLYLITSRPMEFYSYTKKWLNENFPDRFKKIVFTSQWGRVSDKSITKSQISLENGIDLIVEDAPHHALDCARIGMKVILFDSPWNQAALHEKIIRVGNYRHMDRIWDLALDEIEKL